MSLNWNLGPNADEILRKYPSVKHEDGTESQNPVTYTIAVSTMAIGIGRLTRAKAADFYEQDRDDYTVGHPLQNVVKTLLGPGFDGFLGMSESKSKEG